MPQVIDLSAPDGGASAVSARTKRRRPKRTGIPPTLHIALLCVVIVAALGFIIYHFSSASTSQPAASADSDAEQPVVHQRTRSPLQPPAPARVPEHIDPPVATRAAGIGVQMEAPSQDRRATTEPEGIH